MRWRHSRAPEPRVLDLGCGPGSLSAGVLDASRRHGGRRRRGSCAPRHRPWRARPGTPDAHASRTPTCARTGWPRCRRRARTTRRCRPPRCTGSGLDQLVRLYHTLAGVIRPGWSCLDVDRLAFDHDQQAIAAERATESVPNGRAALPEQGSGLRHLVGGGSCRKARRCRQRWPCRAQLPCTRAPARSADAHSYHIRIGPPLFRRRVRRRRHRVARAREPVSR